MLLFLSLQLSYQAECFYLKVIEGIIGQLSDHLCKAIHSMQDKMKTKNRKLLNWSLMLQVSFHKFSLWGGRVTYIGTVPVHYLI